MEPSKPWPACGLTQHPIPLKTCATWTPPSPATRPERRHRQPVSGTCPLHPVDQRAVQHRPAARHTPGRRAAGQAPAIAAQRPPRSHGMPGHHAVGKPALRPPTRRRSLRGRRAAPGDKGEGLERQPIKKPGSAGFLCGTQNYVDQMTADAGRQCSDYPAKAAARQGRAGHRQNHAGRRGRRGAVHAAAAVAHQIHHQGAARALRIRCREPPARQPARRCGRHRPRQEHRTTTCIKGVLWQRPLPPTKARGAVDRRNRTKADIELPNDLLRELDRMEFYCYESAR
ncbi:hypothetical protein FQA39_LY19397 [Lamprigera yunnana]|nr:hypothetical protein FQA39_LY19397 [Lamprigera yunnana]